MTKLTVIKTTERTSADIPLEFKLDSIRLDDPFLFIIGSIVNNSHFSFSSVAILFTARDQENNFINRDDLSVRPNTLRPGEVGYVGLGGEVLRCTDCIYKEEIIIEYKIIGKKHSK